MPQLLTRPKRAIRGLVDRAMAPYVERLSGEIRMHGLQTEVQSNGAGSVVVPEYGGGVPSDLFHMVLHELRTVELERSRGDFDRVVSVGASGRWYFDWFERSVGAVDEHVGVEAFEPEPEDLPSYARWVATTADRFDSIGDADVDLVFAGQTTEHLWAEELSGFLLQARRVLRATGVLVLDSPNRLVTQRLHWSHGGHTVELSPAEISELVDLAGFKVESIRGVWRCRFGDEVLQLEERLGDGSSLVRRITDGADRPDDCFVWWLIARPDGDADPDALRGRVDDLYAQHWPTRVCRGMWPGPLHAGPRAGPGGTIAADSLPFMLRAGRWRIGFELGEGTMDDVAAATIEITQPTGHVVHHLEPSGAKIAPERLWWEFDHPELMLALSIALRVDIVNAPVRVAMPLVFEPVRD